MGVSFLRGRQNGDGLRFIVEQWLHAVMGNGGTKAGEQVWGSEEVGG